ncbi:uncharacterized protein LOC131633191 [Vicia villosa]|uniref:uncharacterized protein LOC131633191 n=1 Tax=Vicia villosa TaxID=3911 RepID=UPI00273B14F7|nr:uncharacterized protein LOC131633191 [Vicia villosa]
MDGVLLVNEILDWAKRKNKSCLLLNVDFEKAYYSVSWNYLRSVMNNIGSGVQWFDWMEAFIFMIHMFVLLNGSVRKDFKAQKGLRQGDPLSLFIFVLAMEGLTSLVRKSVELGDFKPFKYGEVEYVDILQFADDTVILREACSDNLWSMKVLLGDFELISGLKTLSNIDSNQPIKALIGFEIQLLQK